jgi:hypothetical protein
MGLPDMASFYVVYYDTGEDADYCIYEGDSEGCAVAVSVFWKWLGAEWFRDLLAEDDGAGLVSVAVVRQSLPVAGIEVGDFDWWGYGFKGSADILRLSFNGGVVS